MCFVRHDRVRNFRYRYDVWMIEGLLHPQQLFFLIAFSFIPYALVLFVLWKFYRLLKRFVVTTESIAETLRERNSFTIAPSRPPEEEA